MKFQFNDGGRKDAGYKGTTNDCVVRAISIVTGISYQTVYDEINVMCEKFNRRKRKRLYQKASSREGVFRKIYHKYLLMHGMQWSACTTIGSGCKVHLKEDELPDGKIICRLSRHLTAVIDKTIHDLHDCSRYGTRQVYGYYFYETKKVDQRN